MTIDAQPAPDPYRAWLGVRETDRPLNAYQLLSLDPLEDDAESIRRAASRKRGALLSRRGYVPPRIWEQIYSEVEEAARVLLDPELKASYDSTLRMSADSQLPMQNTGAMAQRGGGTRWSAPAAKPPTCLRGSSVPAAASRSGNLASIAAPPARRANDSAATAAPTWPPPSTSKPSSSKCTCSPSSNCRPKAAMRRPWPCWPRSPAPPTPG